MGRPKGSKNGDGHRAGRPKGSKNRPGHRAGRYSVPKLVTGEEFAAAVDPGSPAALALVAGARELCDDDIPDGVDVRDPEALTRVWRRKQRRAKRRVSTRREALRGSEPAAKDDPIARAKYARDIAVINRWLDDRDEDAREQAEELLARDEYSHLAPVRKPKPEKRRRSRRQREALLRADGHPEELLVLVRRGYELRRERLRLEAIDSDAVEDVVRAERACARKFLELAGLLPQLERMWGRLALCYRALVDVSSPKAHATLRAMADDVKRDLERVRRFPYPLLVPSRAAYRRT